MPSFGEAESSGLLSGREVSMCTPPFCCHGIQYYLSLVAHVRVYVCVCVDGEGEGERRRCVRSGWHMLTHMFGYMSFLMRVIIGISWTRQCR